MTGPAARDRLRQARGEQLTADSAQDERQAMPLAVEDLAKRISSQISEGW